ncbi:glycosyltransferase family 4 protein [Kineococcus sp. SYSU DK005]|uniref:glycosyltransferase family 4 protein n=1 Tax=Kineococcus sp. SYSU DK005 TaxID=3383126 RepID=UPI003D7E93AB
MHVLKHAQELNGHVHVAVDLACAQAAAGHHVVFASGPGAFDDLLQAHGVQVERVTEATGKRAAARSMWDLLRVARRERPDVVHAHMMSSAVLSYPIAKLTGALLVTTVHNSFEPHSSLMRLGDVVVAVSAAERKSLVERGFSARKTMAVLNGADGSPREELPKGDFDSLATPCIMTLSGLHPRKAVDDVVRAFALVQPEFPQWHLNVVGWGPDRAKLMRLTEELGVESSVHFVGATLAPRHLLDRADVLASGSLAEPFGLNIAEARAAGCAVVATNVGGIPEVLDQGRAGLLVPPSDPPAMAAAFRQLLEDPQTLARWRAKAAAGSERFTVQRMADDYEQVYRTALAR